MTIFVIQKFKNMDLNTEKEYTVITFFGDENWSIVELTGLEAAKLLEEVSNEELEPIKTFMQVGTGVYNTTPKEGKKIIIIKGTSLMPKSVKIVTKLMI